MCVWTEGKIRPDHDKQLCFYLNTMQKQMRYDIRAKTLAKQDQEISFSPSRIQLTRSMLHRRIIGVIEFGAKFFYVHGQGILRLNRVVYI